ncbi:hypothetical protein JCM15765_14330 [Paradesulfitobacterium aromaticivorans]
MHEFICFPVDFDEKERFQRMCKQLKLKPEEWFRLAIIESEIDIAARSHVDPDTKKKHSKPEQPKNGSDPKAQNNRPRLDNKSTDGKQHPDNKPNEGIE